MMPPKSNQFSPTDMSDWAVYVVVAISIVMTLWASPEMPWGQRLLFLIANVPYTALLIGGTVLCERLKTVWWQALYFIGVSLLGAFILYLSGGMAWLILLPLAAQSVYFFSWLGTFLINFVIFSELMLVVRLVSGGWSSWVQSGVSFIAAQVFVVVFSNIAAKEERGRLEVERLAAELGQANQKLRAYAAQVEAVAVLQERNRLARDIHDSLGHYLTALNMQIKAAQAVLPADVGRAQGALEKAQSLAQDALASVRQSVAALREEPALQQPLPEVLEVLLAACREAGLVAELHVVGEARMLPAPVALTLYRAAQEALTNVRKHALASQVEVTLDYQADCVRLSVADNGVGARQGNEAQSGFGLLGLRERVALLGGKVDLTTAPQQGFTLDVEIGTCERSASV
ncbi:MAG: histidine kinase [Chloroflexota bacterium]